MDGSVKVSDSMLQRLKPRVAKARKTVKGKTSKSIVKAVESAGCMRLKKEVGRKTTQVTDPITQNYHRRSSAPDYTERITCASMQRPIQFTSN